MTALLTLERARARRRVHGRRRTRPAPAESRRRPARRRAHDRPRPAARRCCSPAPTTRRRRSPSTSRGSRSGVRAADEQRARAQLGLRDTHYANPIGLDDGRATTRPPRDLAKLALLAAAQRRSRARRWTARRAILHSGLARARRRQPQHARSARCPWVNGVKTGHTRRAGYVLVGSATRDGVDGRQRRHGRARARPRATPTRSRCCATASAATTARRRAVDGARPLAGARRRSTATSTSTLVAVVRRARCASSAPRRARRSRRRPASRRARGPARRAHARRHRSSCACGGRVVERVPLVTARAVARGLVAATAPMDHERAGDPRSLVAVLVVGSRWSAACAARARRDAGRCRRRRGARRA